MEHIRIPKVEGVKLMDRFNARNMACGTLYLTTTHLIFVDNGGKKEIWILHMHMGIVEKLPITTGGCPLQIHCKNFMCITFVIPREKDCHEIYLSLQELSRPTSIESLHAFHTPESNDMPKSYGWNMYDTQTEYLRMGVPSELWSLSQINKDYEICDTYPRHIYVPACATTPVLVGSSKFRSRGRLPVLSYLHRGNQAAVCRCSQPLSGFSARCVEDEQMLHSILKANPKSNFMYVVDTRPKINAMANKAAGKGYENESFYSDIKFQFLGIENIHIMRTSLQKLVDVCELRNPSMNAFLAGLENSGWLKHIRAVVDTSVFIAKAVLDGISVLVHCSDGWDRTAQTCSLASLMLDPYYRSIQGFQALIEKEWLSFGHKFMDRCGHLDSVDPKEISPVFTQFLDGVWQMMQQFPCAFQFNERFLLTIHDHVYSCQFATFIGNCEKDRLDLRLTERAYSLWGFLAKHMTEYLNPVYRKEYEIMQPILIPDTSPQAIRFWKGMYNRFENGIHPRDQISDILAAAKDHSASLEDHIRLLEKRITQICKQLNKPEEVIHKKLQGFLSMDSLDGCLSEDGEIHKIHDCVNKHIEDNVTDKASKNQIDEAISRTKSHENNVNHFKSDSESGFDESSSQLSRSGIEDGISTLDSSMLSRSTSFEKLSVEQLVLELKSIAMDWRSFRNVHNCSCAMPFDHFTTKFHCWKCGEVFCTRCIARNIPLPGHYSHRPVPVCKPCYKEIRHSTSMEFQAILKSTNNS